MVRWRPAFISAVGVFISAVGVFFLSHGEAAAIVEAHFHITLTRIMLCEFVASIPTGLSHAPRVKSMSQYSSCVRVFSDHSMIYEPWCALCFLRIPKNSLYRREEKPLRNVLPHLTVTWKVRHEANQSHLVPRLRMTVSYTSIPHSICL
jgi:hypothetical protein